MRRFRRVVRDSSAVMKKFYSMEEYHEYYFPKETAEKRDRELKSTW